MERFEEKRRFERKAVNYTASIIIEGKVLDAQITDISASGAKLTIKHNIEPMTPVTLRIPRFGDYCGEISWSRKPEVGIKFTEDQAITAELAYALALYGL